jgi:protein associated with RNAse G/E
MNSFITIVKNNHLGKEVWQYPGELIAQSARGYLFEARFNRSDLDFNGMLLKQNDRSLELYLLDKYFNIYQIYDRDNGCLKGWYCNVTKPVWVVDDRLSYDDLALDLLVFPDGRRLVLDEDEFAGLNLPSKLRKQARAGLRELHNLFTENPDLDVRKLA